MERARHVCASSAGTTVGSLRMPRRCSGTHTELEEPPLCRSMARREGSVRQRSVVALNPREPSQKVLMPQEWHVLGTYSSASTRQPQKHRHVLKSRGHLTEREVKRVRLRTPTVEKCREEGHVELEPWSPVPRSTCRVGHISLHKSCNREKT